MSKKIAPHKKSKLAVHFSSKRQDWATPQEFFAVQESFHGPFDLDVCAFGFNAKCPRFYTYFEDGLWQPWHGVCWMNPPYGREIKKWVAKAVQETQAGRAKRVVCLLPSRTDTAWWHDYVMKYEQGLEYIRGRITFEGADNGAPFASAVVVFKSQEATA